MPSDKELADLRWAIEDASSVFPLARVWCKNRKGHVDDSFFETVAEPYNLVDFASRFLASYKGTNGFLVAVKSKVLVSPLTARQARAVVNIVVDYFEDQVKRAAVKPAPLPPPSGEPVTLASGEKVVFLDEEGLPIPSPVEEDIEARVAIPPVGEGKIKCFNCDFRSDNMDEVIRHRGNPALCPGHWKHGKDRTRPTGTTEAPAPRYEEPEVKVLPEYEPKLNLDISDLPDGRYGVIYLSSIDGGEGKLTTDGIAIMDNDAALTWARHGSVPTNRRLLIYVKRVRTRHRRPGRFMWTKFRRRGEYVEKGTIEVKLVSGDTKELIGEQRMKPTYREKPEDFRQVYRGEHEGAIAFIMHDPWNSAKVYGAITGSCGICGRTLTDPVSKARGIGPDCWEAREGWMTKHKAPGATTSGRRSVYRDASNPGAPMVGRRAKKKARQFSQKPTPRDKRSDRRAAKRSQSD